VNGTAESGEERDDCKGDSSGQVGAEEEARDEEANGEDEGEASTIEDPRAIL